MIEETIRVANEEGLHTRPANKFVQVVKGLSCSVTIAKGERSAPGTSLLKIMKLGVVQGDEITVVCDGNDETDAMDRIRAFLLNGEAGS
jgi:phosphotransferase system HPr (HPr) family protein